jgi:hypothetical protein
MNWKGCTTIPLVSERVMTHSLMGVNESDCGLPRKIQVPYIHEYHKIILISRI